MSELIDPFGRKIEYLRLSVTDRCDLRCNYCMPVGFSDYEVPENWLSFEEIERVINAFARLGVSSVRVTGGEPLLRKDLPDLISRLSKVSGLDDISLSTNGTQLTKYSKALKEAGLNRINVSLDSLDSTEFGEICGRNVLDKVLLGLESASREGFSPIKINAVYSPNTAISTAESLIEYAMSNRFTLRFIEVMPVGDTGRNIGVSNLQTLKRYCESKYGLVESLERGPGPARYLISPENGFKIGFITPMSQHFCETCNRVRLSVEGTIYLCLGQNDKFELRPLLRAGISDEDLLEAIKLAITLKPERHVFNEQPDKIIRIMARTGG
jgi:GTP 3',8-cyclase